MNPQREIARAAMQVHGLTAILTFGFTRYPSIEMVHPADLAEKP